ncbi:MAG: uroporphyrinogen decarboxylase family protein [Anaerolineales bacterium]
MKNGPPDPGSRLLQPRFDLLERLGFDTISLKLGAPHHNTAPPPLADGTVFDEWGVGRKRIEFEDGSFLLEVTHSPLDGLHPQEIDLDAYPWPDPSDPGRIEGLQDRAQNLYDNTEFALIGRFGGTILEQASFLRGFESWLIDLVSYPDFARALLNRIADIQIELDRSGIQETGDYLTIYKASGDDLGMQDRALFSNQVWQSVLRPVLSRRWKAARQALDQQGADRVKLMFHSDGAIRPFIPDLIEDGVQVLDPIQTRSQGMEVAALKADFGRDLVFHGAIDPQQVLPFGSPEDVKRETLQVIRKLGQGGGLLLGPSHNVQPDVPPENLVALSQTAREFGRYPLAL